MPELTKRSILEIILAEVRKVATTTLNIQREVAETQASFTALIDAVNALLTLAQSQRDALAAASTDQATLDALAADLDAAQAQAQTALASAQAMLNPQPPADPGTGPVVA